MEEYKGQVYVPKEDDGVTTESLFKIVDQNNGAQVDVRELLGLEEADFQNNPELLEAL